MALSHRLYLSHATVPKSQVSIPIVSILIVSIPIVSIPIVSATIMSTTIVPVSLCHYCEQPFCTLMKYTPFSALSEWSFRVVLTFWIILKRLLSRLWCEKGFEEHLLHKKVKVFFFLVAVLVAQVVEQKQSLWAGWVWIPGQAEAFLVQNCYQSMTAGLQAFSK